MTLTPEQSRAVELARKHRLLVITGNPGTGKTFTLQTMRAGWEASDLRVAWAAPTGKAAQRMNEAMGIHDALTIHRLLEFHPDEGFRRNGLIPLDQDVVVIDEASMVDVELMSALCSAIDPRHTSLILVGDVDQLPSVGPGQVLRDIIESETVPVVRLSVIMRQAADSAIITGAHQVIHGKWADPDNQADDLKFYAYAAETDPEVVARAIMELVTEILPAQGWDPVREVQVLAPMKRGPCGTGPLNTALQQVLNPSATDKPEILVGKKPRKGQTKTKNNGGERVLRLGDKVIQIRNNYRLQVFNGEVGFVTNIECDGLNLDVDFGTAEQPRVVEYSKRDLYDLWPAYALTVHKSQGSEFPCVVMPLTTSHWMMLQRRLLYTAITRAKECCVLLGTRKALKKAVRSNEEGNRNTRLGELLGKSDA